MPQILVYHDMDESADIGALLPKLHKTLSDFETVKPPTVKTLGIPLSGSVIGTDEQPDQMILIQVRMKTGRSTELKTSISQALHDTARAHINEKGLSIAISCDVVELDDPTYVSSVA